MSRGKPSFDKQKENPYKGIAELSSLEPTTGADEVSANPKALVEKARKIAQHFGPLSTKGKTPVRIDSRTIVYRIIKS